ncbi:MAG: BrnT family toxin [Polyangiaceae bacterium]|nr:BrnT family toxin [Polyangiaceae bacterium]
MRFEWDPKKERHNVAKHGVSFNEAKELFTSKVDFFEIYDSEHLDTEERFIAIGPIRRGLVLIVYTERNEDTIRLISARWASKTERALYIEHMEKDA